MKERRHIVLSGGSKGLGRAILTALLDQHYAVSTFSREPGEEMEQLQHKWPLYVQPADLGDAASLDRFLRAAVERWGPPFGLINNAGIASDGVLAITSPEQIHQLLSVNLEGALLLSRATIRQMLKSPEGGRIINISSIIGQRGYSGLAAYAATKAGMDGMTRALARELGPRRICVNSIAPGYLETGMTGGLSEHQRAQIVRRTPLGRLGTPQDVVGLVTFLLSPAAEFISGQTIVVDGGATC